MEKCCDPKIYSGEHIFRMVKDLKVFLGKGKKEKKNAKKNTRNNDNEISGLFKRDQYFGTYHIGRT
jgi:hypothetical protein